LAPNLHLKSLKAGIFGLSQKYMKTIKSLTLILMILCAVSIGAPAQTVLPSLDGAKIDVQSHRGKVVILAVGASWLPLSAKQAEFTNMLVKKYAAKNVVVYFVVTDSTNPKSKNYASDADVRKFVAANKLSVPVLRDSDGAVTLKKLKIDQVPSFVILNKDGEPATEPFGGIDAKFDITVPIARAVDKVL
jgi:thiol-disulfide isomerase/thioredoxin